MKKRLPALGAEIRASLAAGKKTGLSLAAALRLMKEEEVRHLAAEAEAEAAWKKLSPRARCKRVRWAHEREPRRPSFMQEVDERRRGPDWSEEREDKVKAYSPAAYLGQRGGRVRSDAKTRAAQQNGRLGGRPPKHGPWCAELTEAERRERGCEMAERRRAREGKKAGK